MRNPSWTVLAVALVSAATARAQDLPPYVPVNPILASRSALYAQPLILPNHGWQLRTVMDYSNAIEDDISLDQRHYLLDAEILQLDFWATRDLSPHVFVLGDVALRGGYGGFLDGFLNWYHDLIGLKVPARNARPHGVFGWEFTLPDTAISRSRPGTFLGDIRTGAGLRFGRSQLVATITLPTTPSVKEGWGRGVVGSSLALTANVVSTPRVRLDLGTSVGYTPTHGALRAYQRDLFFGGLAGIRWRFAGQQALFGTVWMQSSNWQHTGWGSVDNPEVTLDFGGLLRLRHGWPELQLGMTEDLKPSGPAIDAGFKLGVRWK